MTSLSIAHKIEKGFVSPSFNNAQTFVLDIKKNKVTKILYFSRRQLHYSKLPRILTDDDGKRFILEIKKYY